MTPKTVYIIGAGPAGITAAHILAESSDMKPVVFEEQDQVGGLSMTVNYRGNRMDIGGHRFFSKSEWVMNYWKGLFPVMGSLPFDDSELGRDVPVSDKPDAPDPDSADRVLLVRRRLSRIFYSRKLFNYPIKLNMPTLLNLGPRKIARIGFSYIRSRLFRIIPERTFEDFLINRFGRELYRTFFKDYTRKVWGVSCSEIPKEWGVQRVKGVSVSAAISHALKQLVSRDASLEQKGTETSLIERFLYPKLGPGQIWEHDADYVRSRGGEFILNHRVVGIQVEGGSVSGLTVEDTITGKRKNYPCRHVISTMPVRDLIEAIGDKVPAEVKKVSDGLLYRDFITVGILLKRMLLENRTDYPTLNNIVPDNWIYVQEPDVKVGRLQIFNNWSPYLVKDRDRVWIALEYFCNEGDEMWNMGSDQFRDFAAEELSRLGIISKDDIIDSVVRKVRKAYPAYFGSYGRFGVVREYINGIRNLYPAGRNGTHRYNNMDHSMLSARAAAENIIRGRTDKSNIWSINTESEYHEEKTV